MAEVFLSYSASDRDIASQLVIDLRHAGVAVWSDLTLRAGDDWDREIRETIDHLERATAIIVLISPSSLQSEWVTKEWSSALTRSSRLLPVLVKGASFRDLPHPLAAIQVVNLDRDYERGVESLVRAVMRLRVSEEPPARDAIDVERIVEDVTAKVLMRIGVEKPGHSGEVETVDDKLVFVVCSFDPEMEPMFEAVASAATVVGLNAERVKDVKGDYRISEKMLSLIRRARLIVADLTHERPNVYFELGYARGLGKTVITLARQGTRVHFDVQDWTYLEYFDSHPLERLLLDRFRYEPGGKRTPDVLGR